MPSPRSELSSTDVMTPGIVIDDFSRPQSPETLIPATDGLSTRPTKGGIAYPFSLKVEGDGREVNASTVTLQSVSVETPTTETPNPIQPNSDPEPAATPVAEEKVERPGVERFVTAGFGDLNTAAADSNNDEKAAERPGVERFETAQEDLTTLANSNKA